VLDHRQKDSKSRKIIIRRGVKKGRCDGSGTGGGTE
jgi:hypothetical protein